MVSISTSKTHRSNDETSKTRDISRKGVRSAKFSRNTVQLYSKEILPRVRDCCELQLLHQKLRSSGCSRPNAGLASLDHGGRAHLSPLASVAQVDPLIPKHLRCDAPKLMRALLNLLTNAMKFTAEARTHPPPPEAHPPIPPATSAPRQTPHPTPPDAATGIDRGHRQTE